MTEQDLKIQHLTDENERLHRALNGEVTKLAREIYLAALPTIREGIKFSDFFNDAEKFYAEALRRERGLGKQAEFDETGGGK